MLAAIAFLSGTAEAREPQNQNIDIAASRLADAIAELSREAGVSIGADIPLPDRRTREIHGRMTVGEALSRLLAGTGLRARKVGTTAWRIERTHSPADASAASAGLAANARETIAAEPIVVTGVKQTRALYDIPMAVSVTVLSDQQRHDTGGNTATIASEVEGLSLTALGPGRNRIFLRGISDSAFNGDEVTLIGQDGDEIITCDEVADWAGTISYEVLTNINTRVPRVYI